MSPQLRKALYYAWSLIKEQWHDIENGSHVDFWWSATETFDTTARIHKAHAVLEVLRILGHGNEVLPPKQD